MDNVWLLLFALFLVLLNGFFVAAEFAIVKVRHTRVEELRRLHGVRGRILATVHQNVDTYLSACQLGITLASLGLGWVGEPAFARLIEVPLAALNLTPHPDALHFTAFVIAFALISYLHIVVGELAPKSAALRKPERIALWTALPLFTFYWVMFPFIWLLNASANRVLRRVGLGEADGQHRDAPYTLNELRMILHLSRPTHDEHDPHSAEMNRLLTHMMELDHLHVSDVMRSHKELVCIHTDDDAAEVLRQIQRHRYSRYPYQDAETGAYLGVLHQKDVLFEPAERRDARSLRQHLRPLEVLHEDTPISEALRRFRLGAPHLALVADRDARIVGFVTFEDVLEAIFGDIQDEHSKDRLGHVRRTPQWLKDESLLVRGDTPLFQLERALGISIKDSDDINTVSGLFMQRLGRMAVVGDTLHLQSYIGTVLRLQDSRLAAVRFVAEPAASSTASD